MIIVKKSSIHHKGVFAKKDIAKGVRIIEYVGEKVLTKEAGRRVDITLDHHRKNQAQGAVYTFELNKRYSIDGNVSYNVARHINHSCTPNAETDIIRGKIWIIAIRDIKKGEEITYNYGYDLDENYKDHPCRCATARCVGFIIHEKFWPKLKKIRESALK